VDEIRSQQESVADGQTPYVRREVELFAREFERRARAMPFVRFVANGEPLPTEIGNVDKLQAIDGSGTYYMFPTSENMRLSEGGSPEDPTQGQEAQGGPLHGITGRGEKYAGGNIETDEVAPQARRAQAKGKGSQTGGTGIQRARLGDASAIEAAVDDADAGNRRYQYPGQDVDPRTRPLTPGTVIEQTKKLHDDEPGYIRRTTDVSKLTHKGDSFRIAKDHGAPEAPRANIRRTDHMDDDVAQRTPKPTKVDTAIADAMKEGQKTATDAAAAGAVTAGSSAADIEEPSAGIVGGFDGRQSADATEGTSGDILQPTIEPLKPDRDPYKRDWSKAEDREIYDFLDDHGVRYSTGATRTDIEAMAMGVGREAGEGLAYQKSDEATPQTSGGVLIDGSNAKATPTESKAKKVAKKASKAKAAPKTASKPAAKPAAKPASKSTKKGGVKITTGKGKTVQKEDKPVDQKDEPSLDQEGIKNDEPGVVKGDDHTPTPNPPADEQDVE
jgi:cell division septation protein DedD